jgi:hypothetical protein
MGRRGQLPAKGLFRVAVIFFHKASYRLILTDFIENSKPSMIDSEFVRSLICLGGVQDRHGGMPQNMRPTYPRQVLWTIVAAMLARQPERMIIARGKWYEKTTRQYCDAHFGSYSTVDTPGMDFAARAHSSKSKGIGSSAGIEEVNFKGMVADVSGEPHQLVQTLPVDHAVPVSVNIDTMIAAGRVPVDQDLEPHRLAVRTRSEDQMEVSRVETICDTPVGLRKDGVLAADTPISCECPLIER